jgi:hypothetical protein
MILDVSLAHAVLDEIQEEIEGPPPLLGLARKNA